MVALLTFSSTTEDWDVISFRENLVLVSLMFGKQELDTVKVIEQFTL